ncbi:MAG: amidohydrolase family protein [Burkholderiales bacterium]
MTFDLIVRNGTVVFPERPAAKLDIGVREGRFTELLASGSSAAAKRVIDATGKHVFPGLIDCHVHFGFGEKITEYSTETVYAAQGGFSTILAYFLNNEAYDAVFERESAYARERCHVDYGFHFCTANELHLAELGRYVREFGVTSFKYFMNFKGEEGRYLGLDGTDDGYFYDLLEAAAAQGDVMVVCHTENIEIVNRTRKKFQLAGRNTLRDWSLAKPAFTEAENLVRAAFFAEQVGARVYIPHLSSKLGLDEAKKWRARYPHVYLETCPHYLTHTLDSDIGSLGKANPPFRTQEDVDALWAGLADGSIETVASDHVPRKRATKEKGIWQASQGFPGTATILPVLLSEGYHKGRISLERIANCLTAAPARIFHIDDRKGHIRAGYDADLTIVDLDLTKTVDPAALGSYSDYSLYEGWALKGWPIQTIVRGETVMEAGQVVGRPGLGQYIKRRLRPPGR